MIRSVSLFPPNTKALRLAQVGYDRVPISSGIVLSPDNSCPLYKENFWPKQPGHQSQAHLSFINIHSLDKN